MRPTSRKCCAARGRKGGVEASKVPLDQKVVGTFAAALDFDGQPRQRFDDAFTRERGVTLVVFKRAVAAEPLLVFGDATRLPFD